MEEDITRVTEFNDENASIQGKAEALGSVVGFGPGVVSLDISALPDAVVQKDVIRKEVEGGDGDGGATMLEADFVRRGFGGLQAGGECLRRGVPGFTVDGVVG